MKDTTERQGSTETIPAGDPHAEEGRRGPTWSGWALSILVAILLSVTATLLLGGSGAFRSDRAEAGAGDCGSEAGSSTCPHSTAVK
jgi:hypothetical protein